MKYIKIVTFHQNVPSNEIDPLSGVTFRKLTAAQLLKRCLTVYGNNKSFPCFYRPKLAPVLSQMNLIYALTHLRALQSMLILSSHVRLQL